jgi:uncharacterized protein YicC (UPF0701 family)
MRLDFNMHSTSIQHFWRSVRRRANWLNIALRLTRGLMGFCVIIIGASLGFSFLNEVPWLSFRMVVTAMMSSSLIWAGIQCWRCWQEFQHWRSIRSVADFVEGQVSELEGRSYLALDNVEGSNFLRERALNKTWAILERVSLSHLLSSQSVKTAIKRTVWVLVLVGIAQWKLPVGPWNSVLALVSQDAVLTAQLEGAQVASEQEVVVGDLTVHYTFPEYTGMAPVEVQNSDGAVRAPQGTKIRVTAKTLKAFKAVQLQINDTDPVLASLEFGRNIEATFTLDVEGTYRFLLFDGEQQRPSQPFDLVFDDDDPPVVSLEIPKTSVPSNLAVSMKWNARDDFGLERVVLEVDVRGETHSFLLRKPERNRLEMGGQLKRSIESLKLKGGDVATLRMVAYDNHSASDESSALQAEGLPFGQRGVSSDVIIQVMTRQMTADEMLELNRKLRDLLIPILAEYLVEEQPTMDSVYGWSLQARTRYDKLRALTDSEWSEGWPTYLSAELIAELFSESGEMFRTVTTTFGPQRVGTPSTEDLRLFAESYTTHIERIERTIFLIDRMLRQVAFAKVGETAQSLDRNASRLAQLDFDTLSAQQIVNRLSALDDSFEEISDAVTDLGGYSIKEFVEGRLNEVQNLEKVVRDSVDTEESTTQDLANQFSMSVSQFSEGVQEMLERSKAEEDKLQEEMESLIEKLEELDAEQQELAEKLTEARSSDPNAKKVAQLWQQIEQKMERSVELANENEQLLKDGRGFRTGSIRSVTRFSEDLQSMLRSVIVRDQAELTLQLLLFERQESRLSMVLQNEGNRSRPASEPKPPELTDLNRNAIEIDRTLDEIRQMLTDEAFYMGETNPEMLQFTMNQVGLESDLESQLRELLPKITEVEQQMPTATGEATEFAQQGVKAMEDAIEVLKEGDDMAGESLEYQASARIQDTIEALKQAAQDMQQMQQQSQQMMTGESTGESSESMSSVELNPLEKEVSPEEYRKMLLEGMQGDVPDEYQALKKKYYEELVAQ